MPVSIVRTDRADRAHWVPLHTSRGYQLVSRATPYPDRNKVAFATFVGTMSEAAELVERGYAIRMAEPGAPRGNYIYPEDLRIDRT